MHRSRGVTLIEMIVAMGVALVVMTCAYALYRENRLMLEKPRASYSLQDDLLAGTRWIQRDLSETNLLSIRTFPNSSAPDEPPGMAMLSPRSAIDEVLVLSEYGGVRWQKYIYYTLEPVDATTGNLVRMEGPIADMSTPLDAGRRVPLPSTKIPTMGGDPSSRRIVARHLLLPNASLPAEVGKIPGGGFEAGIERNGLLQPVTGTLMTSAPITVDLRVFTVSTSTGRPSMLSRRVVTLPQN